MRSSAKEREIQCSLSQEGGNLGDRRLILGDSLLKEITAASSERAGELKSSPISRIHLFLISPLICIPKMALT